MDDAPSAARGGRDYLFVALAALTPYLNTLANGFVLDDVGQILLIAAWLLLRQGVLGSLTVPPIDFVDNPLAHLPVHLRVIEINPGDLSAWQNLADPYFAQSDFKRAAVSYQELMRLYPNHPLRADIEARIPKNRQ